MFQGDAVEALHFYQELFADFQVLSLEKYGEGDGELNGKVRLAMIEVFGQQVQMIDSPVAQNFDFTPSFSFYLNCDSEEELDMLTDKISAAGETLMPADNYGFSSRFAWVNDRFGVSWQLNVI
jgi:predicted 3-demethylubiquinone-9 3-methyltransferase (glyoxalase superfamily)